MNQYFFLQRITGPAMILTFGITALLDEWHILGYGKSWPLYLIVLGVIKLAQRAALLNAEPPAYPPPYAPPAAPPPPGPGPAAVNAAPPENHSGERS
ncbi:MAG TPA: hypothetical protein VFA02_08920 [Pseudacidobacterium sp.]|nr:hypothetical protein [Pseudacidobacterium sp.]